MEVKAAVLQLVNSLTCGADSDQFTLLRADLTSQLFAEKYEQALRAIEEELALLVAGGEFCMFQCGAYRMI